MRPPETAIVTPSPGAPIVIEPGGSFWADVVLRIPLTPPPGVQQERALNGFAGWATGFSDLGPRPLVPLVVSKIRPAGPSTQYRMVVETPPWIPTGVYDLRLEGRAFAETASRALVVERSAVALDPMSVEELATEARAAALSGVEIALVTAGIARPGSAAGAQHAAWLDALREVGLGTAVFPSPDDRAAGAESFRRRVAPLRWTGPSVPPDGRPGRHGATTQPFALEGGQLVLGGPAGGSATARLRVTGGPSVLEADGRQVPTESIGLAGSLNDPVPVRTFRVEVPRAGARRLALLSRPRAAAALRIHAPLVAHVHQSVRLSVEGAPGGLVGWSFGDETTAAGARVVHRFGRLGTHKIEAVRVGPDGEIARADARIRIDTDVRTGCAAAGQRPPSILPWAGLLWLIWVRPRRGNFPPRAGRSEPMG